MHWLGNTNSAANFHDLVSILTNSFQSKMWTTYCVTIYQTEVYYNNADVFIDFHVTLDQQFSALSCVALFPQRTKPSLNFFNSSSIINQQPSLVTTSLNHILSVTRHQALIECLFWPRPNQFWQLSHLHCPIQWGLYNNQKSRVSKLMAATQHRLSSHIFQSIAGKCFGTSWLIWAWLLKHAGENCWNTVSACSLDLNFDKVEIDQLANCLLIICFSGNWCIVRWFVCTSEKHK